VENKLKIGILIHSDAQTAWVHKMLENIIASDYAEISLIIRKNADKVIDSSSSKLEKYYRNIWYYIYTKLDEQFFNAYPSAFELKNIGHLIKNVECITVKTNSTDYSDRFYDDDLEKINKQNLDVLIRISGFKILRGGILNAAKCGIWSFHHGDSAVNRGGPAGFWEVLEKRAETGVVLQILTEDLDGGTIIDKSFSRTYVFSVNRNLNNYYWKALSMVPRNLSKLHTLGPDKFKAELKTKNITPYFYSCPLYKKPKSFTMINGMITVIFRYLTKLISEKIWLKQWILLYDMNKNGEVS